MGPAGEKTSLPTLAPVAAFWAMLGPFAHCRISNSIDNPTRDRQGFTLQGFNNRFDGRMDGRLGAKVVDYQPERLEVGQP